MLKAISVGIEDIFMLLSLIREFGSVVTLATTRFYGHHFHLAFHETSFKKRKYKSILF